MTWLKASVLAVALTLPTILPAMADDMERKKSAEELAREAGELAGETIRQMMQAMEAMIGSIPQYEAPEVLPNGDIILRRKRPPTGSIPRDDELNPDETRT
jgi:hypothetical protein